MDKNCEAEPWYTNLHIFIFLAKPILFLQYAFQSAVAMAGLTPEEALVELQPRQGELTLRTEDILAAIKREGDTLACVLLGGVHYYTGQKFDIQTITKAAHEVGAYAGMKKTF